MSKKQTPKKNPRASVPLGLLPLRALAEYIADQPDQAQLARAVEAARRILQMPGDSLAREEARQQFIQVEGEDHSDITGADSELMTAAQVQFGDPAFLFGVACGWLLFGGRDGAR